MEDTIITLSPLIDSAGATVILLVLVVFAWQVVKLQHVRTKARDEAFMEYMKVTTAALMECIKEVKTPRN